MSKKYLLVLVLMSSILSIWTFSYAQNSTWEFAFSDTEYDGSIINDILVVEDRVWLAGAKDRCHTPGIWLFDTSGQMLEYIDLTLELDTGFLYGYGKVMELQYDSLRNLIMAMGQVAPADDVGAFTAALYTLTVDGDIKSSFDFTEISNESDQSVGFWQQGYVVAELNQVFVMDSLYQLIDSVTLPIDPFSSYIAEYASDTFFVLREHSITSYNSSGDTINQENNDAFDQFVLLESTLVAIDIDQMLRTFQKNDLSRIDSMSLSEFTRVGISATSSGELQLIGYNGEAPVEIIILDEQLTLIEHIQSELSNEQDITAFSDEETYYLAGTYYQRLSQYGNVTNGVIPFTRKQRIDTPTPINRPSLEIIDVVWLEDVIADEPATYHVIIHNTGDQVIQQFGYHTSSTGSSNCGLGNWYGEISGVDIAPGDTFTYEDSLIFNYMVLDSIRFYVVGPNHLLHTDTNFVTVHDFTTPTFDVKMETTNVFPNPATQRIYIKSPMTPTEAMIVNHLGQVIQTQVDVDNFIDVSALNPGLYYLLLDSPEGKYRSKFIKL